VALPAAAERWHRARAERCRNLQWAFAVVLFLSYGFLVCYGLSRHLLAHLVSAQAVYLLLWGTVLGLASVTYQERSGAQLLLRACFDEERVRERRRKLAIWFSAYMTVSLVVIAAWLTPEVRAPDQPSGRAFALVMSAVSSSAGILVTELVLLVSSVIGVAQLDQKWGTSLVQQMYVVMMPLPDLPNPALSSLLHAAGTAQRDHLLTLLLRQEEQGCALSLSRGGLEIDLYRNLPQELREFIETLTPRDEATAGRYLALARNMATRLEKSRSASARDRAKLWHEAFRFRDDSV